MQPGTWELPCQRTSDSGRDAAIRRFLWTGQALVLLAMLIFPVAGCGPPRTPYPASLQSEDPGDRVRALKRAAEMNDRDVLGLIVDRLEDEDEAVRMFAILALEKMTGTRLDYRYYAPAAERRRIAAAWRKYLREHGAKLASGSEGQGHE